MGKEAMKRRVVSAGLDTGIRCDDFMQAHKDAKY
jgi:hypothetical protein